MHNIKVNLFIIVCLKMLLYDIFIYKDHSIIIDILAPN